MARPKRKLRYFVVVGGQIKKETRTYEQSYKYSLKLHNKFQKEYGEDYESEYVTTKRFIRKKNDWYLDCTYWH